MTAAALESGRFDANSEFLNVPELELPLSTKSIKNSGGRLCGGSDNVTLEEAFRMSCNIPFAELGLELGEAEIASVAEDFGFGATLEIPLTVTQFVPPGNGSSTTHVELVWAIRCSRHTATNRHDFCCGR